MCSITLAKLVDVEIRSCEIPEVLGKSEKNIGYSGTCT